MKTETKVKAETLSLIDTDTLSYILKQKEPAYQNSWKYLKKFGRFQMSCITYYECFRGYKANGATTKLKLFQNLLQITDVIYLDKAILEKAGEIYSILKNKGLLTGEFLVPTRWRGNAVQTRQRPVLQARTLARPDPVPTLASGNQNKMTAVLVEAVKELKAQNDALKAIVCEDHPEKAICQ
jgi:predicted nucleic acid-binding protein